MIYSDACIVLNLRLFPSAWMPTLAPVFASGLATVVASGLLLFASAGLIAGCGEDDEILLFMQLEFACECELESVQLDQSLTIGIYAVSGEEIFGFECAEFEGQEERHLGDLPALMNASRTPRLDGLPEGLEVFFQLAVWNSIVLGGFEDECPPSIDAAPPPEVFASSEEQLLTGDPDDIGMAIDCEQLERMLGASRARSCNRPGVAAGQSGGRRSHTPNSRSRGHTHPAQRVLVEQAAVQRDSVGRGEGGAEIGAALGPVDRLALGQTRAQSQRRMAGVIGHRQHGTRKTRAHDHIDLFEHRGHRLHGLAGAGARPGPDRRRRENGPCEMYWARRLCPARPGGRRDRPE